MIRHGDWKLVDHDDGLPELYHLGLDHDEVANRAGTYVGG